MEIVRNIERIHRYVEEILSYLCHPCSAIYSILFTLKSFEMKGGDPLRELYPSDKDSR